MAALLRRPSPTRKGLSRWKSPTRGMLASMSRPMLAPAPKLRTYEALSLTVLVPPRAQTSKCLLMHSHARLLGLARALRVQVRIAVADGSRRWLPSTWAPRVAARRDPGGIAPAPRYRHTLARSVSAPPALRQLALGLPARRQLLLAREAPRARPKSGARAPRAPEAARRVRPMRVR